MADSGRPERAALLESAASRRCSRPKAFETLLNHGNVCHLGTLSLSSLRLSRIPATGFEDERECESAGPTTTATPRSTQLRRQPTPAVNPVGWHAPRSDS